MWIRFCPIHPLLLYQCESGSVQPILCYFINVDQVLSNTSYATSSIWIRFCPTHPLLLYQCESGSVQLILCYFINVDHVLSNSSFATSLMWIRFCPTHPLLLHQCGMWIRFCSTHPLLLYQCESGSVLPIRCYFVNVDQVLSNTSSATSYNVDQVLSNSSFATSSMWIRFCPIHPLLLHQYGSGSVQLILCYFINADQVLSTHPLLHLRALN